MCGSVSSGHSSLPVLCMHSSFIFNEDCRRTGTSLKRATLRLSCQPLNLTADLSHYLLSFLLWSWGTAGFKKVTFACQRTSIDWSPSSPWCQETCFIALGKSSNEQCSTTMKCFQETSILCWCIFLNLIIHSKQPPELNTAQFLTFLTCERSKHAEIQWQRGTTKSFRLTHKPNVLFRLCWWEFHPSSHVSLLKRLNKGVKGGSKRAGGSYEEVLKDKMQGRSCRDRWPSKGQGRLPGCTHTSAAPCYPLLCLHSLINSL